MKRSQHSKGQKREDPSEAALANMEMTRIANGSLDAAGSTGNTAQGGPALSSGPDPLLPASMVEHDEPAAVIKNQS